LQYRKKNWLSVHFTNKFKWLFNQACLHSSTATQLCILLAHHLWQGDVMHLINSA